MLSNNLVPFAFDESMVRVIREDDGTLLFVAKDIALALGYNWNGVACIGHVPEEWRWVRSVLTHSRGEQDVWFLTEQGLYFFLARSDKPKALPFQKWLAGEVLPTIRKTGSYTATRSSDPLPEMPEAVKRLKPMLRERVLADAIQAARLGGTETLEDIDALFLRYCTLVADGPDVARVRLPGMAFSDDTQLENVRRFAHECLRPCKGNYVNATDMYACFRNWWLNQFDAALPSMHVFGRAMNEVCSKQKRGGKTYYTNIALVS